MGFNPNSAILEVVNKQGADPITVSDARDYLRIDVDDTDDELLQLIRSAVDYAESMVSGGITLTTKTYDLTLAGFPLSSNTPIVLPRPPLTSVTSVKYYDGSNVQQTWTSTEYGVFTPTEGPGYILPSYTYTWPTTVDRHDAVTVRYVAGFGSVANMPPRAKQAIRYLVTHFFENRDAFITGTITAEVGLTIKELLRSCGWGYLSP